MVSEISKEYLEFIAGMGYTKHYGSMAATRELAGLCHIGGGQHILDVGCGVGATPSFLAREYNCRIMGVDLIEKMIEHSKKRARADRVENKADFKVADARELPFEDNMFDVVISESVNVFFKDKAQAMREYLRVVKPGGYVGTTEMTWLKTPTQEIEDIFLNSVHVMALNEEGWKNEMEMAGLVDVVGAASRIDVNAESRGRLERYGLWGLVKIIFRMLALTISDSRARYYMKRGSGALSREALDIVGYGVYAGKKPG